jgi:hypothetical protein
LEGYDQDGGEVSKEGLYLGQKKEEMHIKKIFGSSLSGETFMGCPLCGSSLCGAAPSVMSSQL